MQEFLTLVTPICVDGAPRSRARRTAGGLAPHGRGVRLDLSRRREISSE